jgi:branched-chain amino acid transport system substrate-binding protein
MLFLKESGGDHTPVQLVSRDPGPAESRTVESLTELVVNEKVQFLVGPMSLEATEKAVHGSAGSGAILFVINPSVRFTAGELCMNSSFRVRANTYQVSRPMAPWALKNLGTNVFLTGTDAPIQNEQADFFAYGFERAGGEFTDRVMVEAESEDFDELLQSIRDAAPDLVFAAFSGRQAALFIKAFRNASPALPQALLGPDSLTSFPYPFAELGTSATGIKTLGAVSDPTALAERIKSELGRDITNAERAAEGYDIAGLVTHVVSTLDGRPWDPSAAVDTLEGANFSGFRGPVRFDANHEPILELVVEEWRAIGASYRRHSLERLGEVSSLDFGCGRVGFPERPDRGLFEDEPLEEDAE